MDKELIGQRIRMLRERRHETKRYVAKKLGVSYSSICQIEYGLLIPGDNLKVRISDYFGIPVGEIFFDSDNNETWFQKHGGC